ncbi:magnesium transporter [Shewanella olleyana]|uniref:magnesium transporter n=1 Tax=Shewanella olleyana TaxID=135626 RepID=UPI00200BB2DB|nr:magnesium transporter [Shewanella olleyana]MCL1068387.1 magnesium transporter [Shewanella olleyana]
MTEQLETAPVATNKPNVKLVILKKSLTVIAAFSAVVLMSYLFSLLTKIHGKALPESYFINGYPSILGLLDSELFMGFVFVVTISIICYILLLFWRLHEVAVHKAEAMSSAHTQIVFALSLCGLFIDKAWWVLAIIIAFGRWDVLANRLSSIISNGLKGDK